MNTRYTLTEYFYDFTPEGELDCCIHSSYSDSYFELLDMWMRKPGTILFDNWTNKIVHQ